MGKGDIEASPLGLPTGNDDSGKGTVFKSAPLTANLEKRDNGSELGPESDTHLNTLKNLISSTSEWKLQLDNFTSQIEGRQIALDNLAKPTPLHLQEPTERIHKPAVPLSKNLKSQGPGQDIITKNLTKSASGSSSVTVYYDSFTQTCFEELVKSISATRNSLRKDRMRVKVEQIKRLAEFESHSPDNLEYEDEAEKHRSSPLGILKVLKRLHSGDIANSSRLDIHNELEKHLEFMQSMCEVAAHEFLRNGDCKEDVERIVRRMLEIRGIAEKEVTRLKSATPGEGAVDDNKRHGNSHLSHLIAEVDLDEGVLMDEDDITTKPPLESYLSDGIEHHASKTPILGGHRVPNDSIPPAATDEQHDAGSMWGGSAVSQKQTNEQEVPQNPTNDQEAILGDEKQLTESLRGSVSCASDKSSCESFLKDGKELGPGRGLEIPWPTPRGNGLIEQLRSWRMESLLKNASQLGLPQLREGFSRLRWRCSCGTILSGDFDNTEPEELRNLFNDLHHKFQKKNFNAQKVLEQSELGYSSVGELIVNSTRRWRSFARPPPNRRAQVVELLTVGIWREYRQYCTDLAIVRKAVENLERMMIVYRGEFQDGTRGATLPQTGPPTRTPDANNGRQPALVPGATTAAVTQGGSNTVQQAYTPGQYLPGLGASNAKPVPQPPPVPPRQKGFFEVCINTRNSAVRLAEIPLEFVTSDRDLFKKIWDRYRKSWGCGVRQVFLKPRDVHFVMFSISQGYRDLAGIHNKPREYPPQEELDKRRYHYRNPKVLMPANIFLHFLHHARKDSWEGHHHDTWLQRLPKKLNMSILDEILKAQGSQAPAERDDIVFGWGVHILEGPNHANLSLVLALGIAIAFLVSCLLVGVANTAEQGFGVGQFLIAVVSCGMMAGYFALEDR